jgi:hypothetical protein
MQHNIQIEPYPGPADDVVSVSGDTVIVNEQDFDLSQIPDGGYAIPSGDHPFVGRIYRDGDTLRYQLRVQFERRTAERDQNPDRSYWNVTVRDESLPDLVARKDPATIPDEPVEYPV